MLSCCALSLGFVAAVASGAAPLPGSPMLTKLGGLAMVAGGLTWVAFYVKFQNFIGYVFPKKLGLDEGITSWQLKNRIPRQKLYIESYSHDYSRQFRSKYLKIDV